MNGTSAACGPRERTFATVWAAQRSRPRRLTTNFWGLRVKESWGRTHWQAAGSTCSLAVCGGWGDGSWEGRRDRRPSRQSSMCWPSRSLRVIIPTRSCPLTTNMCRNPIVRNMMYACRDRRGRWGGWVLALLPSRGFGVLQWPVFESQRGRAGPLGKCVADAYPLPAPGGTLKVAQAGAQVLGSVECRARRPLGRTLGRSGTANSPCLCCETGGPSRSGPTRKPQGQQENKPTHTHA